MFILSLVMHNIRKNDFINYFSSSVDVCVCVDTCHMYVVHCEPPPMWVLETKLGSFGRE